MNAEAPVSGVTPPPSPRSLADTGLSMVMMRDILLKTMFRTNQDQVTALSKAISLPVPGGESIGLQLIGPPGADLEVLQAAAAYQDAVVGARGWRAGLDIRA